MATERISWTSDAPTTEFSLYADRVGQDKDDMTTTVRIYIKAVNRGSSSSYANYPGEQKASIDDYWAGAAHKDDPLLPRGVAAGATRWYDGPWNIKIPHGKDGKRGAITLRMRVSYGSVSQNITKSFGDFPDIDVEPYTPTVKKIATITSNSAWVVRNNFKGPDPTSWEIQYQDKDGDDAKSWSGAKIKSVAVDDDSAQLTNLARMSVYRVRLRAKNAQGTSDWSVSESFETPAAVPGPTNPVYIDAQGQNGIHYKFNPPSDDGGADIQQYQVGYGTDPNGVQSTYLLNNGDTFITGLNRYTTYYVWSRARNEAGWGPWSVRIQQQTQPGLPAPPVPTFIGDVTQVSLHYSFQGADDGGAPILEWQVGYGTDPNNVQNIIGSPGSTAISGLQPATVYYVWSRARNVAGWSNWSVRSSVLTTAGIRIKDDAGIWREAVPYVKDNGTWHVAKPYAKSGTWKPSV
jgi:hypothetical protein